MSKDLDKEIVSFEVEGHQVRVVFGKHTIEERCLDRGISHYSIASLIMALGEQLLDLSMNEARKFGVLDVSMKEGAICSMSCLDGDIWVDVITVVNTDRLFVKNGSRVLKLNDVAEKIFNED